MIPDLTKWQMGEDKFDFEVYRMNILLDINLFSYGNKTEYTEDDILYLLKESTKPDYKEIIPCRISKHEWNMRDFLILGDREAVALSLARSQPEKIGNIVTSQSIVKGISESQPPLADVVLMIYYVKRHLFLVEKKSMILKSRWRKVISEITRKAGRTLGFAFFMSLEPVLSQEEILNMFYSFDRLTRLRVKLRLPNPELSEYTKHLFDDLNDGAIREYFQDMKNLKGLSTSKGKLPYATTEMAQAGYKEGSLTMEGLVNDQYIKKQSSEKPVSGSVNISADYIRGLKDNAKTIEAKRVLENILKTADRIAPRPGSQNE